MSGHDDFHERPDPVQLPLFRPARCEHKPDHRFGFIDYATVISPVNGINQAHDEDYYWFGQLVCRLCASVYVGAYTIKGGTMGIYDQVETIMPSSSWEAPEPITCPVCVGTGKGPRRQVRNHGAAAKVTGMRTTTTCIQCNGICAIDPRDLTVELEETRTINSVVDDIATPKKAKSKTRT